MSQSEAVDLLLRSAGQELDGSRLSHTDPTEEDLTKRLGGLPIAIVQAGAFVGARNIPLRKYPAIFDRCYKKILSEKPQDLVWSYGEDTVFTTWEVSFQAIEERSQKATELLSLCSFLSNENIDEEMLCRGKLLDEDGIFGIQGAQRCIYMQHAKDLQTDPELGDYLKVLYSYSLIQHKASEDGFYINSVVHTWAHERLKTSELIRIGKEAAILVGRVVSYASKQPNTEQHQARIINHVETVSSRVRKYLNPEGKNELVMSKELLKNLNYLVTISIDWGRWENAEKLQLLVIYGTIRLNAKTPKNLLTSKANLASIYQRQERLKDMEQLQREVMEDSQKLLGMEDPFTIKFMKPLASTYKTLGRQEDAEEIERDMGESVSS